MPKLVAIHQPNFFPWLGYFNKIVLSDAFIIMDNVQFPKKGGTWSNRVKLLFNGNPQWVTMPIVRNYHGTRSYREMCINHSKPWQPKLLNTIRLNYAKAPYFQSVFDFIKPLIMSETQQLSKFNITTIHALLEALDLKTKAQIIRGSDLTVSGQATELLIAMVRAAEGDAYLCGGGARGYQQDELFEAADIQLIYQSFAHPIYPQFSQQATQQPFIPGLSIIDALMNCGFEQTRELILSSQLS